MLVYRIAPIDNQAEEGEPYHPLYIPTRGKGRIDNPTDYQVLYCTTTIEAAIGETFGMLSTWNSKIFHFPLNPKATRQLCTYKIEDEKHILNLDNPHNLVIYNLKPSQVITRQRNITQALSLEIYNTQKYSGLAWWSFYHPEWTILGLWKKPTLLSTQSLKITRISI